MNAIHMLTRQHRQMEAAFDAVSDADAEAKATLFARAADLFISHLLVEEQLFYPTVRAKRTEDVLLESLEEHLSLKRLVADLVALPETDPTFDAKLHVLIEQAEHHHEEEEGNLFPRVMQVLTSTELDALGARMGEAQARLLTRAPRNLAADQTEEAAPL